MDDGDVFGFGEGEFGEEGDGVWVASGAGDFGDDVAGDGRFAGGGGGDVFRMRECDFLEFASAVELEVLLEGEGVLVFGPGEDDVVFVGVVSDGAGGGGDDFGREKRALAAPAAGAEVGVWVLAFFGAEERVEGGAVVKVVAADDMLEEAAAGKGVAGGDDAEGSGAVKLGADRGGLVGVLDGSAEGLAESGVGELRVRGVVFAGGLQRRGEEFGRGLGAGFGKEKGGANRRHRRANCFSNAQRPRRRFGGGIAFPFWENDRHCFRAGEGRKGAIPHDDITFGGRGDFLVPDFLSLFVSRYNRGMTSVVSADFHAGRLVAAAVAALFALAVSSEAEGAALEDLCKAAEDGNLGAAQNAVANGANVNEHGCAAQAAPLHRAVWSGKMNVITLLVAEGANVNARQMDGAAPLHIAMENLRRIPASGPRVHNADIVNYLLEQNPNVNAQDNNGKTPLVKGLEYNFLIAPAFDALLNNNANVNLADNRNIAPLHLAAYREIGAYYARELLNAGANPNQCGPGGRTPLHFAALVGNAEKVTLLLENGANIHAEDDDGQTAARLASDNSILNLLRDDGAGEAVASRCENYPAVSFGGGGGGGNGGGGGGLGMVLAGGVLILGAAWVLTDGAAEGFSFSPLMFYENTTGAGEVSGVGGRMEWRGERADLFWRGGRFGGGGAFEFGGAARLWQGARLRGKMKARNGRAEWQAGAEWGGVENLRLYAEREGDGFWRLGAGVGGARGGWRYGLRADGDDFSRRWRGRLRAEGEVLF